MSSILLRPANLLLGGTNDDVANFPWLRGRNWDLIFLILSAGLCIVPYTGYLLFGANENARQLVNGLVTLLIAGPHMYATFNRTVMDCDFRQHKQLFLASSVLIP